MQVCDAPYQSLITIGLTNEDFVISTTKKWCYMASSAHGVQIELYHANSLVTIEHTTFWSVCCLQLLGAIEGMKKDKQKAETHAPSKSIMQNLRLHTGYWIFQPVEKTPWREVLLMTCTWLQNFAWWDECGTSMYVFHRSICMASIALYRQSFYILCR